MQLVIAAMTTWPWSSSVSVPSSSVTGARTLAAVGDLGAAGAAVRRLAVVAAAVARRRVGGREALVVGLVDVVVVGQHVLQGHPEGVARFGERDAVLRALGAGDARHHLGQVELDRVGVRRLLGVLVVPQPLLLGVGLHQGDLLGGPPGELQVAQCLGVDGEDGAGRAELRGHVADGGPVGQRQAGEAGAVELDELADDAALAQHLGDGEDEIGGRRPLVQLAGELEAEHLRDEHRHRLAEHRRLGLDAAHAPAQHAEAVDHRGVRVGSDQRVGVGEVFVRPHPQSTKTTRARYSRLTWCTIPVSGGTTLKLWKAPWPQRRKA